MCSSIRASSRRICASAAATVPGRSGARRTRWPSTAVTRPTRWTPAAAARRLAADIDEPELARSWSGGPWRPWYAALWAEAAVLDHHPDAATRVERSRQAARDNPIATAMVDRATAIATGDRDTLVRLAITFAQLGCPYQQARTGRIAAGPRALSTASAQIAHPGEQQ
jgi:hypothetical protein